MFDEEWLKQPKNKEDISSYLVPIDEPTHPDDVKKTRWYKSCVGEFGGSATPTDDVPETVDRDTDEDEA